MFLLGGRGGGGGHAFGRCPPEHKFSMSFYISSLIIQFSDGLFLWGWGGVDE